RLCFMKNIGNNNAVPLTNNAVAAKSPGRDIADGDLHNGPIQTLEQAQGQQQKNTFAGQAV
ncbi:MAG: hypothetical protein PVH42_22100, partial [Desulfobacterales bacterium]